MFNRKNKWFIIPVGLFFLALMGLIIWLVSTILNFRFEEALPEPYSVIETPRRLYEPTAGPFAETVIRIEDEETMPSLTERLDKKEPAAPAGLHHAFDGQGNIPAVCETHGPQIQARDAFNNPLIHDAIVGPTRVTVSLTLEPEGP